jgi:hypothetical protein
LFLSLFPSSSMEASTHREMREQNETSYKLSLYRRSILSQASTTSPHPHLFLSAHLLHGLICIGLIHFTPPSLPLSPLFPLLLCIYGCVLSVINPHL